MAFTLAAIRMMARLPRGTFVVAVTNPPVLPHAAWLMSLVRGIRYAVLVWDIYPEHLVASGIVGPASLVARGWRTLNKAAFGRAALIVTIGHRMAQTLSAEMHPADRAKLLVIPNWADPRLRPIPKATNAFARATDQVGRLTVLYAGNVGRTQGLEELIGAADLLRSESRLSFVVVGDGFGKVALEDEVRRKNLDNVCFLDRQEWNEVPLLLATGDIAVVAQEPGKEALSLPSKTYSSLAAGSAILAITHPESDLAQIVKEHDVGVRCDNSADEIAAAIRGYLWDEPRLRETQDRAAAVASLMYTEDAAFVAWRDALDRAYWMQ